MNREIRVREVRVIGPEGEQLGILPTPDAFRQAQEGGYDLVEVAPTSVPRFVGLWTTESISMS